jgi:hypothetical protein
MIESQLLSWLSTIAQWYLIIPFFVILYRWKTFDFIRQKVSWYIFFNISFAILTLLLAKMRINNLFIFYLSSPAFVWMVFGIYELTIGNYKIWKYIKLILISFSIFVLIDMFFIENYRTKFPANIYPSQEIIILLICYYYIYIFSKEARRDFSLFWITIGIGISALIMLVIVIYYPDTGFVENTIGHFIWAGLGSMSDIISNSFITYGLYIARPKILNS